MGFVLYCWGGIMFVLWNYFLCGFTMCCLVYLVPCMMSGGLMYNVYPVDDPDEGALVLNTKFCFVFCSSLFVDGLSL